MITLALDCSFSGLSLALQTPATVFALTNDTPRSSDILPTELEKLLQVARVQPQDIERICVTTGPGSFTGIRLGLATAEALKLLNPSLQVVGLSTLQALAVQIGAEQKPEEPFSVLLDAAGGQYYHQEFDRAGVALSAAECTGEPALRSRVFAQASLMHPLATPVSTLDARYMLQLTNDATAHLPPQPVYLKPLTYKKV